MPEIPFLGHIIIEKSFSRYFSRIVLCPSMTLICSGCPKITPQTLQGSFGPDNNKGKIDTWIWKKLKKRCISFSWQAYSWCITFRQLLHHFVCIRQFRSDWLAVRRGKEKALGTAGSQGMNYSRGAQRRNDIVNRRPPPARGATPHSDNHSS